MAHVLLVAHGGATSGLCDHLAANGFGVKLVEHLNARNASALLEDTFDVFVVDAPSSAEALGIVKAIRASGNLVPIVVVSAEGKPEDRVRILNTGADSYFTRPYSALVLVAQVRAHARRSIMRGRGSRVASSNEPSQLHINVVERSVFDDARRAFLPPREFALVRALAYRQGSYVRAESLLRMVWGEDFTNTHVVASCVRQVRRRLAEFGSTQLIESRRGYGYRLTKQVTVLTRASRLPAARRPVDDVGVRSSGAHAG